MTNDGSETITLSRAELYDKLWNTATTKLARDFGLSDVVLGKTLESGRTKQPLDLTIDHKIEGSGQELRRSFSTVKSGF